MKQTLEEAVRSEDLDTDVALPRERPFWQDYLATVAGELPKRALRAGGKLAMYALYPVLGGLPADLQERLQEKVPEYNLRLAFVTSLFVKVGLYSYAGYLLGGNQDRPDAALWGLIAGAIESGVRLTVMDSSESWVCAEPLMWTGGQLYKGLVRFHKDMVRLTDTRRRGK